MESAHVLCLNSYTFVSLMERVCMMLQSYCSYSKSSTRSVSGDLERVSAIKS